MGEINKCSSYFGLAFSYVGFITGCLGAALPLWMTTEGTAFEYMNLGFWKYCREVSYETTDCFWLPDSSPDVSKWLKVARVLGVLATVMIATSLLLANLYTLPNKCTGSRIVFGFLVAVTVMAVGLIAGTLTMFCLGRDDHDFIKDFRGPVRLSHSFYLMMASGTALLNVLFLFVADVWETYHRKLHAYKPPTEEFLQQIEEEHALYRYQQMNAIAGNAGNEGCNEGFDNDI